MYDEELDMALENAYDNGYIQALMDMGVDPDEIVEEDVDMFDDNYFDEAMEGPAREYRHRMNEGKTPEEISRKRYHDRFDSAIRFKKPRAPKLTGIDAIDRNRNEDYKQRLNLHDHYYTRMTDTPQGARIAQSTNSKYIDLHSKSGEDWKRAAARDTIAAARKRQNQLQWNDASRITYK